MAEPTGQPSPPATGTTGVPVSPPASGEPKVESIVNADGTFIENWHTKLKNEALHKDETLPRFKNLDDLAQSYVHVRKQVPMDKVALPTETSPPEIWDDFFRAKGRPDTPDEYVIEKPKDLPDEFWDDELTKEAKSFFHKLGFNKKEVNALMEFDNKRMLAGIKAMADMENREKSEAETVLRKKWGVDYDAKLHLANRMIQENVKSDEQKQKLLEKIGNDPITAEFLADIAGKFKEHGVITDIEPAPSETMSDIDRKISEFKQNPAYMQRNHPDHKYVMDELSKLYKQKTELQKTAKP